MMAFRLTVQKIGTFRTALNPIQPSMIPMNEEDGERGRPSGGIRSCAARGAHRGQSRFGVLDHAG